MDISEILDRFRKPCICGKQHTLVTDTVFIGKHTKRALHEYLAAHNMTDGVIIADENTNTVTGSALAAVLDHMPVIVIPADAHATEIVCADVQKQLDALPFRPKFYIACGSGSLHDVTRYLAFENDVPFISYPTAASVDGFVSGIAAMTIRGTKVSYPSRSPIALFADVKVFADAPEKLTASGVGDLLGKYVCLADWKIANILTGEEICPAIVDMEYRVLESLEEAIHSGGEISHTEYVTRVMEGLVLSGLAIQLNGNSRPASGAEHHLSHFWEMKCLNEETGACHGEQVGVATLLLLKEYKKAAETFSAPFVYKPECVFNKDSLKEIFGSRVHDILKENQPDGTPYSCSLAAIPENAPVEKATEIRKILDELPSEEQLLEDMETCGCLTTLGEIDLSAGSLFLYTTLRYAPYVRNRLTFLKFLEAQKL